MDGSLDRYAGVVLNQNAVPTGYYPWRASYGGLWIYQTFTLPSDFTRGTESSEVRNPDLAGFQVLVGIDSGQASRASLNYTLQYYNGNWNTLSAGSVTGAHTDGPAVWMDVFFPRSVPVPLGLQESATLWRIGIQTPVPSPISQVAYVSPTPLTANAATQGQAFGNDGVSPLLASGTASLNFRLLALTADNGVDFLGNEYRSCVVEYSPQNTDTTDSHTNAYWLGPPRPSRFAVESLYFDMRPVPTTPQYGNINLITNPSFEYDALGSASPRGWSGIGATLQVTSSGGVASGLQACSAQGVTGAGASPSTPAQIGWRYNNLLPVTAGDTYQLLASLTIATNQLTGGMSASITWLQSNKTTLVTDSSGHTITSVVDAWTGLGPHVVSGAVVAPATASYAQITITASGTAPGLSFQGWLDAVAFVQSSSTVAYFDGDQIGFAWLGQPGLASSAQVVTPQIQNDFVVIDGVLVDPITPNLTMNVYYTLDDTDTSSNMTESDWENKLWSRVPQSYRLDQRKQYLFPAPVHAKYMKLEFTNLQARTYRPTDFQKPVAYKRFPPWVVNYFIGQMSLPAFVAQQVNVQYDALALAYRYYLDDLASAPVTPTTPASLQSALTSYFNTTPTGIDATTLAKINLELKPFSQNVGQNVDTSTQLGSYVASLFNRATLPQVSEGGSLPALVLPPVSTQAVFDQTVPDMYFFLTARHSYQTLAGLFEQQRAYFAGINDVAFVRHNYGIASDTALYIETNGDLANTELSDFVLDPDSGSWYVY